MADSQDDDQEDSGYKFPPYPVNPNLYSCVGGGGGATNRIDTETVTAQYTAALRRTEAENKRVQKSKRLFLANLTESQKLLFEQKSTISVTAKSGRVYKIYCGHTCGNIITYDRRNNPIHYCLHIKTEYACPLYDHILAQKLLIETDEKLFLKLANEFGDHYRTFTDDFFMVMLISLEVAAACAFLYTVYNMSKVVIGYLS
jgi:hypothetical protein